MKILWIGSYASDEMLAKMPVRSIGQASGITSQKSIIYGIDQCIDMNISMDTLNAQGFPTYPSYPEKFIERSEWSRNGKSTDISISFNNRKSFRLLSQLKNYKNEAENWLKEIDAAEDINVIVYEPVIERLVAARWIKKHHKKTQIHLIVPDIPEYVGGRKNKFVSILKGVRKKILDYLRKAVDKYIFYAEPMATYYGIEKDRYIIMEGSFDPREAELFNQSETNDDGFVMMYSGAISKTRAVDKFVEAFEKVEDPNVKLWFTGGGDYEQELKQIAENDSRITLYGYLSTRAEVLSLQSRASVLLHIRDCKAVSSDYCFPSKLFEYMASGKLVVTVRIGGIPDEYYNYMIVLDELTPRAIEKMMRQIKQMPRGERIEKGRLAKEYVLKNKNSTAQAEKILKFILKN